MKPRYTLPILLVTPFLHAPGPAAARTLTVPDPYPTIQTAIDSAAAGDTVLVSPGLYEENLDTQEKWLVLKSVAGAEATVIDGMQLDSVIRATFGGVVEGFTIRNGRSDDGGGIFMDGIDLVADADGTIRNNTIEENTAGLVFDSGRGGGIYLGRDTRGVVVENNLIQANYAGLAGGGIHNSGVGNRIESNRIDGNGCYAAGGGILSAGYVCNNLVIRNWSDNAGGGVAGGGIEIRNNTIVANFINNPFTGAAGMMITGSGLITNNLVANNYNTIGLAVGIACLPGSFGVPRLKCNDSWGHDWGNFQFTGSTPCDTTDANNISVDPLFCDPENGNYSLQAGSPCSEEANPTCGQIGTFGVACPGTSVERATWGRLKQMFDRRGQ